MRTLVKFLAAAGLVAALAAPAAGQTPHSTPKPTPRLNKAPSVELVPAAERVTLAAECYEGEPVSLVCRATGPKLKLSARAADPDGDSMRYTYSTTGGRVEGDGPEVVLDLTGLAPGVYAVTVEVDDGNGGVTTDAAEITVERCSCPMQIPDLPRCPAVTVSCPDMMPGGSLTFAVKVESHQPDVTPTFNWTVSAGEITGGQGTSSITVDGSKTPGSLTATVDVGGYDRSCQTTASCTVTAHMGPTPSKVDEYGDVRVGDEKRRLDMFLDVLRGEPAAQGYLLCYGGRRSRANEARRRCDRAKTFLVVSRGVEGARLVTVDGGYRERPTIELWLVPSGTSPPPSMPTVDPKDVRPPRKSRPRGRR